MTLPSIDRNRCEAQAACVEVCPNSVFEIRSLTAADRAALSLGGTIRAWAHGRRQAYLVSPEACNGCALCVSACPEGAIVLV